MPRLTATISTRCTMLRRRCNIGPETAQNRPISPEKSLRTASAASAASAVKRLQRLQRLQRSNGFSGFSGFSGPPDVPRVLAAGRLMLTEFTRGESPETPPAGLLNFGASDQVAAANLVHQNIIWHSRKISHGTMLHKVCEKNIMTCISTSHDAGANAAGYSAASPRKASRFRPSSLCGSWLQCPAR